MSPLPPIALVSFWCVSSTAIAQPISESREWIETYSVTANIARLEISNIWGNVKVSSGAQGNIVVAVKELRAAAILSKFHR